MAALAAAPAGFFGPVLPQTTVVPPCFFTQAISSWSLNGPSG